VAGNFDSVDLLLKMGANANYKLPNCLNALLFALEKGSERICLRLLSVAGIDVNSSMPSGDTALHLAIRLGMNQVASKIIPKFGDFLKAKTKSKGYNPLHEAASQGNHGIVD
jgi:ankyrin repeat protein